MNEKGRNILPVIGIIMLITLLLGGFTLAKGFETGENAERGSSNAEQSSSNVERSSSFGITGEVYSLDETGDISVQGIDKIAISAVSSEINIHTHDSNQVEAHFYGNIRTRNKSAVPYLEVFTEGKTVHVSIKHPTASNISVIGHTTLDVLIPEAWAEALEIKSVSGEITAPDLTGASIKVSTVSGRMVVDKMSGKHVQLNSTSGSYRIGEINAADSFRLNTISGEIGIQTFSGVEAELNSTSGRIIIETISSDKVTVNTISGDFKAGLEKGEAAIKTASGEINVEFREHIKSFKANSISGGVKLVIPEDSEFEVNVKTISGNIECKDFAMNSLSTKQNELKGRVGEEDNQIEIGTASGNIEIRKR